MGDLIEIGSNGAAGATVQVGLVIDADIVSERSGRRYQDVALRKRRIFVQFTDSTGAVRGETSVAVETM